MEASPVVLLPIWTWVKRSMVRSIPSPSTVTATLPSSMPLTAAVKTSSSSLTRTAKAVPELSRHTRAWRPVLRAEEVVSMLFS